MAAFADLPNELPYAFMQQTRPEYLENFAQISKQVQAVARALLHNHRALIRKYHHIFDNKPYGKQAVTSLLQDHLTTPYIAQYVREAKFGCLGSLWSGGKYTEHEIEWLCKMAADNEYLVPYLSTRWLQASINQHRQDATLALLLPLHSNLEMIRMEVNWYSYYIAVNVAIRKADNYSTNLRQFAALPSVKEISTHICTYVIVRWRMHTSLLGFSSYQARARGKQTGKSAQGVDPSPDICWA